MSSNKHTGRNVAVGALVAAGIGYVAGLLTAPKSGKETRKDIQKTAHNVKSQAEKTLKNLSTELSQLIVDGKAIAKEASAATRAGLADAIDRAQAARDKVRGVLSAIHESGVDDKELQKAVEEAKKAADHLRKFVDKTKEHVKAA